MAGKALVGHTGFVGSNLLTQTSFSQTYNSRNIEELAGQDLDLLVFSGAQAKKWWANQNPEADWAGIERALDAVRQCRARQAVLVSTIDVLPPGDGHNETTNCDVPGQHAYGANRRLLEEKFQEYFDTCLIVRLPGLFGPGLKKNVIYDLLTQNILETINPASSFQFYDLQRLWSDIRAAQQAQLKLVHLFTEPIETDAIHRAFFADLNIGMEASPKASYNYKTLYAEHFGGADGYVESASGVMARLEAFIAGWRAAGDHT